METHNVGQTGTDPIHSIAFDFTGDSTLLATPGTCVGAGILEMQTLLAFAADFFRFGQTNDGVNAR